MVKNQFPTHLFCCDVSFAQDAKNMPIDLKPFLHKRLFLQHLSLTLNLYVLVVGSGDIFDLPTMPTQRETRLFAEVRHAC